MEIAHCSVFNLKGYSYKERLNTVFKYCKLTKKNYIPECKCDLGSNRNDGCSKSLEPKKNQKNYVEIYIKSDLKKIIKAKKKKVIS